MNDIENDGKNQTESMSEESAQISVRDLVKNASSAFDILNDDGPVVTTGSAAVSLAVADVLPTLAGEETAEASSEILAGTEMSAEMSSEISASEDLAEESASAPAKKSRRSRRKEKTPVVEWSKEAATLDFVEEGGAAEGLSAFEELARRVAATVSRNQNTEQTMPQEEESLATKAESDEVLEANFGAGVEGALDAGIAEASRAVSESREADNDDEVLFAAQSVESSEFIESVDESDESPAEEDANAFLLAEMGAVSEADLETEDGAIESLEASELDAVSEADLAEEDSASEMEVNAAEAEATDDAEMEQMGFAALGEEESGAADNDADPEPTEFIEADQLISIVESLLFSTDKPVSIATIKQIFKGSNVRTKDITRAIDSLASEYASATRGVTLEEINGGYQLRTKSDNAEYLRRLQKVRPFRLSGPALEVMAIVAYKQPITKHEIDEIRGVESGHLLRALMERSLVCFGEKSDLPGKPMTYGSTRKFLEIFGLRNLKELPTMSEIDELLPEGIGEETEKETLSDLTERMSQEVTSSYSEGEDELLKINEQLQSIDTTSEFFEQEKQRERDRRDRDRAQDLRERLMVGEQVEEKDRRWLDRYEARLAAQELAAQAGTPMVVSADEMDAEPQIVDQLETLTSENQREASGGEDDEELNDIDAALIESDDASIDDLAAHTDWDESEQV